MKPFKSGFTLFLSILMIVFLFSCKNNLISPNTSNAKIPLQDRLELAYKQELEMTRDLSTNSIPKERLLEAEDYIKTLNASAKTTALVSWTERGPNNIGGRVRAVLFDRADATGNTVYVGSVAGGLWKTTNFKTTCTWNRVLTVSANLAISAIAQDPNNFNRLYIGTGEGFGNFDAVGGGGVFTSADGGANWTILNTTSVASNLNSPYFYINDIKVDANGYIYLATSGWYCNTGGLFKSKDLGVSFTRITTNPGTTTCASFINGQGNNIQIASNGDVYASTGTGNGARVYVSRVANFTPTTVGDLNNFTNITPAGTFTRIEIAVAPNTPGTLYGIFTNGSAATSIQKTINSGTSWTTCANPNSTSNGSTQNFASAQAWYSIAIAVDPNDANSVVVGGLDLCRSKDGGVSFEQISVWSGFMVPSPLTFANNYAHADHHKIIYQPGSSANVIFGNDGGIQYSANMNNAIGTHPTITVKNTGLNITQYYAADFSPTGSSAYLLAGTQDNGTQKLTSTGVGGGTTVTGGDGGFCHIDQSDGGNIQISSYVFNYYSISTNGGVSFPGFTEYGAASQGKFINPTDYDDANNILYTSTSTGRYGRLSSIGATPSYTTVTVTGMLGQVSTVKVDPNTPTTIYLAANGSGTPEIYRVTNANGATPTFTAIPITGTGAPAAGAYLSCIDVEIGNSAHMIATCSNYGQNSVWETTNGGTTWSSIEGNLPDMPVRWCTFIPSSYDPGFRVEAISGVYLATEMGLWSTTTLSGATTAWVQNSNNIGNVRIDMVKVRPVDGFVAIATHGRGMFSATLANALPVKLSSFTATKVGNNALLNWAMATQQGIDQYELEWSADGLSFVTMKNYKNNNSLQYEFLHTNVKSNNYYRIKFVNNDGSVEYSIIKNLRFAGDVSMDLFPNPFVSNVTLRSVGQGNQISVYNSNGLLVYNKRATSAIENIDLSNQSKGNYVLSVRDNNEIIFKQKIVKQ